MMESYLTFKLDHEIFAINVRKVLEILELRPITKVPKSPPVMRGVINLRGTILPVIDTRSKFEMQPVESTIDTCIVVLTIDMEGKSMLVGALVDSVQEVIEMSEDTIQTSPSLDRIYKEEFIRGMGSRGDRFIMILDIDSVFSVDELLSIKIDN
jgi:purine-binding chemotaxis protein CheW